MSLNTKRGVNMSKKYSIKNVRNDSIYYAFIILCFLIFISPLFSGLFFEKEMFLFSIIMAAILLFIITNMKKISISLIDLSFFMFIIFYFISIFNAANVRLAVGEFLRLFVIFFLYWVFKNLLDDDYKRQILVKVIYYSSFIVAISGILASLGILNYADAFKDGRIFSTLQYPNVLAVYLLGTSIFGFIFMLNSDKKNSFILYAFINYVLIFTIAGTMSRGGLLLIPFIYGLFILFTKKEKRLLFFINILVGGIISFIPGLFYINKINNGMIFTAVLIFITFLVFYLFLVYLINFILNFRNKITKYILLSFLVLTASLLYINIDYVVNVAGRIINFDFQSSGFQARYVFTKDAIKIAKDNILIGLGGGAWESIYKKYRTYSYFSTKVHNYYIETWLEAGLFGLIFFITGILLILYMGYKNRRDNFILGASLAALAILLHSIIDFDLSFGAINIYLWSLLAIISSKETFKKIEFTKSGKAVIGILLIIYISQVVVLLYAADLNETAIAESRGKTTFESVINKFHLSNKLDPHESKYIANIAQSYYQKYIFTGEKKYLNLASESIEKAIKKDRYNHHWYALKAKYLIELNKYNEAYMYINKFIELDPLGAVVYSDKAILLYKMAEHLALYNNDKVNAVKYLNEIIGLEKLAEKYINNIPEKYMKLWKGALPTDRDDFKVVYSKALFLLGKNEKALEYINKVGVEDENVKYLKEVYNNNININNWIEEKEKITEDKRIEIENLLQLKNNVQILPD
jgi:O-antigen ligase